MLYANRLIRWVALAQVILLSGCSYFWREDLGAQPTLENMYLFLDSGDRDGADLILDDIWPVPRYEPVRLSSNLTWNEDPYGGKYWRFIFYSLRPTKDLLYAYRKTGKGVYRDKLISVMRSFVASGQRSEYFWDKHSAAFRAMVLTNTYWKLKNKGDLPEDLDRGMRESIYTIALFLENPKNFDHDDNHGVTEAAALLLIARNFPDFDKSAEWHRLAYERIDFLLTGIVDEDGAEIEQSPFYHFYVLRLFWQILEWGKAFKVDLPPKMYPTLRKMIRFGVYMAQPDGKVPLLGASLPDDVRLYSKTLNRDFGREDAHFEYVRSAGKRGEEPTPRDMLFPTAGYAIMRSAFGPPEGFLDQTHLVFDVGPYRTAHSDLDALHVHLYAHGKVLLRDSGLFSYDLDLPIVGDFYKSTRSHNTVTVDDKNQHQGTCTLGLFRSESGFTYQSAYHELYDDILHRRGVLLVGKDLVLVVDQLRSDDGMQHKYEQIWHIPDDAQLRLDGTRALVADASGAPLMTIQQALVDGLTVQAVKGQAIPHEGWFSDQYEKERPAYSIKYRSSAEHRDYVTLFALGELARADKGVTVKAQSSDAGFSAELCARGTRIRTRSSGLARPGESITVSIEEGACAP